MAEIKNTPIKNVFGDGYEQEVTLDNGETYTVKNTPIKNVFGDGYEKEIVKNNKSSDLFGEFIGELIAGLILWGLFNWLCH